MRSTIERERLFSCLIVGPGPGRHRRDGAVGVVQGMLEKPAHVAASCANGDAPTPCGEPGVLGDLSQRSAACANSSTTACKSALPDVLAAALSWPSEISGTVGSSRVNASFTP